MQVGEGAWGYSRLLNIMNYYWIPKYDCMIYQGHTETLNILLIERKIIDF